MRKLISAVVITVVALVYGACGGSSGGGTTTTTSLAGLAACAAVVAQGVICGRALAPDGQTPIAGAEVVQVTSGASTSASVTALKGMYNGEAGKLEVNDAACFTDAAGNFACAKIMSGGTLNFRITSPIFQIDFDASITLGSVTNVPNSSTTATGTTGTFAVVLGAFDSIEDVLARVLNCGTVTNGALEVGTECPQIELIDAFGINPNTALTTVLGLPDGTYPTLSDFLQNANTADALALFDGVFFNCGMGMALINDTAVLSALQTYVSNGGNFYASDWAYDFVQGAWADAVTWYGDGSDMAARVGSMNAAQTVNVANASLLTWLRAEGLIAADASTFPVNFNYGDWVVMTDTAAATAEALTADNLPNGPGDVPVAPRTTLPIMVDFAQGTGCVFYTSYHNEPASEVSADAVQSRVLEYMLLNRFGNCN